MTTVHAAIGNSDDKLSQADWSRYVEAFHRVMVSMCRQIHGQWYSEPRSPFQNACMAIEIDPALVSDLKAKLDRIRRNYDQESVAINVSETEFITDSLSTVGAGS